MKRVSMLLIVLIMCFSMVYAEDITVSQIIINDELIDIPEEMGMLYIIEGRTMVPVRFVLEYLGFQVLWDDESQTIICAGPQATLIFQINHNIMFDGQQSMEIDVAPILVGERSYLPIRFFAEAIGYEVGFDYDTYIASLTKK